MQTRVILQGAEELAATEALALFLGDEPRLVIGRTCGRALETVKACDDAAAGSILVFAEPGFPCSRRAMTTLFEECRRVIRPGGRIAVLAANRWPSTREALRAIVSVARSARRPIHRVGRASLRGVMTGLRESGWQDISAFTAKPSADAPETIELTVDTDGCRLPAFLVTAGRDGGCVPYLLDSMLNSVWQDTSTSANDTHFKLLRVHNSARGKSVAIARRGSEAVVLRIARSDAMLDDEMRGNALLRTLQSNTEVRGIVPRPVAEGQAGGLRFFAQSRLDGLPLSSVLNASNRSLYLAEAESFLRAVNRAPGEATSAVVDELRGAAVGQPMVPFVLKHIEDASLRARVRVLIDQDLRGIRCRVGIVHGDFGTGNLLVSGGHLTGIIDWEAAYDQGLPVLDAINYLDATHRQCTPGLTIADTVSLLIDGNWPVSGEIEFLKRMFDYYGMDFHYLKGVGILYAMFHIGPQLRFIGNELGPLRRLEQLMRRLA